jgi:hypothetical protein
MQNGTVNPTSELKSADENWSKASEAKNLDQFMSFVADDVYDSAPDGKWIHGKAAIPTPPTPECGNPRCRRSRDTARYSSPGSEPWKA